jgi:hypothetical protein
MKYALCRGLEHRSCPKPDQGRWSGSRLPAVQRFVKMAEVQRTKLAFRKSEGGDYGNFFILKGNLYVC